MSWGFGGGQGRGRTGDLPLFRRTLVPTELPGRMSGPGVVLPMQLHPFHNIAPAAGGRAAVYTDTNCGDEPAEMAGRRSRAGGAGQLDGVAAAHTCSDACSMQASGARSGHTYKCVWPVRAVDLDCWRYHRCDRSLRRSNDQTRGHATVAGAKFLVGARERPGLGGPGPSLAHVGRCSPDLS